MRSALVLGYVCAIFVAVVAGTYGLNAGISLYLVASGRARPGEPIYLDERAAPVAESAVGVLVSVLIVALGAVACSSIRRQLHGGSRREKCLRRHGS